MLETDLDMCKNVVSGDLPIIGMNLPLIWKTGGTNNEGI
jgi:hypothetical protein